VWPWLLGILIVYKKAIIRYDKLAWLAAGNRCSFVTPEGPYIFIDSERREEGGTPGIVESIRAGLVATENKTAGQNNNRSTKHASSVKYD